MRVACLVDTTRCIGCRSCQVACKQAHGLEAEETKFFAAGGGYQNPPGVSAYTRTYVSNHEVKTADGRLKWVFVKRQCMHCAEMRCAEVCAPVVFHRTPTGVVAHEADKCIGCSACIDECPFGALAIDYWKVDTPHLRKCDFCLTRQTAKIDEVLLNGKPLSGAALARHKSSFQTPACAKACPADAIQFGPRDRLLAEAKQRIAAAPQSYVDHVYGEKELGGTGWLYLAAVPFDQIGLPTSFPARSEFEEMGAAGRRRGGLWATVSGAAGTLLAGACWFFKRRDEVRNSN